MATCATANPTLRLRPEVPRAINRAAVEELGLQLPLHRGCTCHYATMPYRGELHLFIVEREGACENCRRAAQAVLLRIIRGA
jgi:hypothetical protein